LADGGFGLGVALPFRKNLSLLWLLYMIVRILLFTLIFFALAQLCVFERARKGWLRSDLSFGAPVHSDDESEP